MSKQTYDNYYKDYYEKNKKRIKAYRQTRYKENNSKLSAKYRLNAKTKSYTPEWRMWYYAKLRAEAKGLPFNIELSDIKIPERCPILDIPLESGGNRSNSPSLDKVIPLKGYVKGNICVISQKANMMKSNLTKEIILKLLTYIDSYSEEESSL